MRIRASELECTTPLTRSGLWSSVTGRRVWPVEMQRRIAVPTSSEMSTVTTAGIGVMTWRACCSCRWKTPVSIPASPGSRWPPACAWAMIARTSSGVEPSSKSWSPLMPSGRSSALEALLSRWMNGRMTLLKRSSGRAHQRATRSALTIA